MDGTTRTRVVVGIDRSEPARAAVEYAAGHAVRTGRPLHVVHAYEPWPYAVRPAGRLRTDVDAVLQRSAQRLLDETVEVLRMVFPDVAVTSTLAEGPPAYALVEESRSAETLVVGSRGAGGFPGLMLGSTTLNVASHARCPVVAVPATDEAVARHGVVVGVDGSEVSEAAIGWAFAAAAEMGEPLVAVHAWTHPAQLGPGIMLPLVYDPELVEREEQVVVAESLAGWSEKHPDVPVESKVLHGHPVRTLARESERAKLLVVGSHGRGALRSMVLGSVGHGLLHHATAPVAIVRRTG